jgi:signal transduction histidine kinase
VSITPPIRHRLVTVVFLGVVTSALSLVALVRMLSTATTQRIERGRDFVSDESGRLAQAGAQAGSDRRELLADWPRSQIMGMRGGFARPDTALEGPVPPAWRPVVHEAIHAAARGAVAAREATLADGRLVASARPVGDGTIAWAAWQVRSPPYLDNWRWIVVMLSLVTLLLVIAAVHAVITVKAGASALNQALARLASDLSTPVPRPPVRELSDIADGVAALARSLAQAREAQERLAKELALKERLAALGRVVAGVAHEVRNPLASIKLRLDLAVSGSLVLPPPVQQAVSHASAEIARLDRLVADLLVVAGRSIGPQRPTDLAALVRQRVAALGPWAELRLVGLDDGNVGPGPGDGGPTAQIDADSLGRAVDNLLRNAVEASAAGDVVTVSVAAQGAELRIRVEDRGAGVAGERAAELFEPFFTTKADGTGLGLAISRAIARAHGGDVVYARQGAVTAFELTVPRRLAPPRPLREAAG